MKKIIVFFALLFFVFQGFSQIVTVIDKSTLQLLSDVHVYGQEKAMGLTTNSKGQVDISAFKNDDTIYFRYVGYAERVLSYSHIQNMKFKVALSEKTYSMDEVVVSASRFNEKKSDVPHQIRVIKVKELEMMNQQTMAEVMQGTGEVLVQKSQMGGGSPIMRGFEANKLLMVVDGVRMNNAIYRSGHLQNVISLDNSILEKTEIVFGPGSVVYGSDALGGVMHFYTKNPIIQHNEDSSLIKANAYSRYSTAYNEKTEHIDFNIALKKVGFLTSVTISDFGDLHQGNIRNPYYGNWGKREYYAIRINGTDSMVKNKDVNLQKQTAYKQRDFMEKMLFQQNDKISHVLNIQYSTTSDIPRYDRLTEISSSGTLKYAQWYYGPQNRLLASYSLNLKAEKGIYNEGRVILAFQDIEESRNDRKFNSIKLNHRTENVKVYSLNADFGKKIKNQEIRYGIEENYNKVTSIANVENILTGLSDPLDTRYPDGGSTMQTIAAYITHSWEISPRLILSDGIRYSNISLKSKFVDTTFFHFPFSDVTVNSGAFNGKVGIAWTFLNDWRIAMNGSSGYRAPNLDDMTKVFSSAAGNLIVPNPSLKPEYTYNAELGVSKIFNRKVKTEIIGYYTVYNNIVTTDYSTYDGKDSVMYDGQLSRVTTLVNKAEAFIYGLSGSISADITDDFSITSSLNYTYGRIITDTTDYPLDHIPPVFGKTSFNLQIKKFRGEFFVAYNGAKLSKNYNLIGEDNVMYSANPVDGFTPAWYTLNLRTAWQINKYIQLQLALENILDHNYRVFASGIGSPGRNFIVTLRGKF